MPTSATALEPVVLEAVRAGDVVIVKGSKYTLVSKIVPRAPKSRFGDPGAPSGRPAGGPDAVSSWPTCRASSRPLNVFRYITFRTGGAIATALLFVFWLGPAAISALRIRQGKGQPIRDGRAAIAPLPSAARPRWAG